MKKYTLLAVTLLAATIILYTITRPPARDKINDDFKRRYTFSLYKRADTTFAYRVDLLASFNGQVLFYSMGARLLGLMDTGARPLRYIVHKPLPGVSSIHSISVAGDSIYCFDLNGRVAGSTDLRHDIVFNDSLRAETRGAVVNAMKGFTTLWYNIDSARVLLYDSLPGEKMRPLFAYEKMGDRGFSHWGLLLKDQNGSRVFQVPFYNSRVVCYDYGMRRVSFIQTIERTPVKNLGVNGGTSQMTTRKAPIINRKACANSKYLFMLSYARNQTDDPVNEIIDVYDLATNSYHASIVLKDIKKGQTNAMTCIDDQLVLSNGNTVLIYTHYENDQPE